MGLISLYTHIVLLKGLGVVKLLALAVCLVLGVNQQKTWTDQEQQPLHHHTEAQWINTMELFAY